MTATAHPIVRRRQANGERGDIRVLLGGGCRLRTAGLRQPERGVRIPVAPASMPPVRPARPATTARGRLPEATRRVHPQSRGVNDAKLSVEVAAARAL